MPEQTITHRIEFECMAFIECNSCGKKDEFQIEPEEADDEKIINDVAAYFEKNGWVMVNGDHSFCEVYGFVDGCLCKECAEKDHHKEE